MEFWVNRSEWGESIQGAGGRPAKKPARAALIGQSGDSSGNPEMNFIKHVGFWAWISF
jgi:hypothetical protein